MSSRPDFINLTKDNMRKQKIKQIRFFPNSWYEFIFRNKEDKEMCYDYINNPDYTYLDIWKKYGISSARVWQKIDYYNKKFRLYFFDPKIYESFYINNPNKK